MIKKLIFDLDNTLIKWEDEKNWQKAYEQIKKIYDVTEDEFEKIKIAVNEYEKHEDIFSEEKMQENINKAINKQFKNDFLQMILNIFADCIPEDKEPDLDITLEYLSNKYELVVLTNWFEWPQNIRLEKYGIRKYFSKVFGADKFKLKPNKEAFETAMENNSADECIMIGDGIINDIEGARGIGLAAILLQNTNITNNINNANNISSINNQNYTDHIKNNGSKDDITNVNNQDYRVINSIAELRNIF